MEELFGELSKNIVGLRIERRALSATFDRDAADAFNTLSSMVSEAVGEMLPLVKSFRYKCNDVVEVRHGGGIHVKTIRCEAVNDDGTHVHVEYRISDDGVNIKAEVVGVEFKRGE